MRSMVEGWSLIPCDQATAPESGAAETPLHRLSGGPPPPLGEEWNYPFTLPASMPRM